MSDNEKYKVSGVAVREGISRNNRKYIAKELDKFAPTLIGRPILKDHEGVTDNVIGKITNSQSVDNGKLVTYEGWIKEDGSNIIEKLKDGRISEVSIGAMSKKVVKEKEEDDFVIPTGLEALELSTTPVPGVRGTSVSITPENTIDMTEEGIKKMIESYDSENIQIIEKEEKMSEDAKNLDALEAEKVLRVETETKLAELKAKLEASEESATELTEARRQDAIDRYKEKAKAKNVKAQDVSSATMETIKALTAMVEDIEELKDDPEDDKDDSGDDKSDEKTQAKAKSKIAKDKDSEKFDSYVIDVSESVGNTSFYKYY